jgi:hypothetical protein
MVTTNRLASSSFSPRVQNSQTSQAQKPQQTAQLQQSRKAMFTNDEFQTTQPKPLPADIKADVAQNGVSSRRLEGAVERGVKEGGYKTAVAWAQELTGQKVDGKFGMNTYKALADEPGTIQQLRDARIAETPNAKNNPLNPLNASQKEWVKNELTKARDEAMAKGRDPVEAVNSKMQELMVRAGEPMMIDGKLGKQSYESMCRLYGKSTADELGKHIAYLKTTEGDC